MEYTWETAEEINMKLAGRVRAIRRRRRISQKELAERSGVSYGSVKRFEEQGLISLSSLIKIAIVLRCENEIEQLFTKKVYRNIDEVIKERKYYIRSK